MDQQEMFKSLKFNVDINDQYLTAESSAEISDIDEDGDQEEFTSGFYFSLPDINLDFDFNLQLTEPFCPSLSYDHFLNRLFSPSGLVLIPKHTTQKPQIEFISLCDNDSKRVPDFAFLNSQNLEILQTCNGLFLCFSPLSNSYTVCNLATQELDEVVLPSFEFKLNQFSLSLAYDPYNSPHYKLICVQKDTNPKYPLHELTIYSSEDRVWTHWGEPFDPPHGLDFTQAVYSNGAIHWMRRATKGLYFDVEREILREMPNAPTKAGGSFVSCEYFGESQGCLYYVVAFSDLPYLEAFVMKDDYTGWVLKSHIDLKSLSLDFPIMAHRMMSNGSHPFFSSYECDVLFINHGWGEEGLEVVLSIPGQVIAYNEGKKCVRKLCDLRVGPSDRAVWYRVYSSYQYF